MDELKSAGKRCLFLGHFELRPVHKEIPDADALVAYVTQHLSDEKLYVFLDEVQNGDILPPPTLMLRGGGFPVKNTCVFR